MRGEGEGTRQPLWEAREDRQARTAMCRHGEHGFCGVTGAATLSHGRTHDRLTWHERQQSGATTA